MKQGMKIKTHKRAPRVRPPSKMSITTYRRQQRKNEFFRERREEILRGNGRNLSVFHMHADTVL